MIERRCDHRDTAYDKVIGVQYLLTSRAQQKSNIIKIQPILRAEQTANFAKVRHPSQS